MIRHSRTIFILTLLCCLVFFFNHCINRQQATNDVRSTEYAGSEKCASCHKSIYETYTKTAHFSTSAIAGLHSIKGSFNKDSNTVVYRPNLKVVMEKRDSNFFQVSYIDGKEREAEPFDMIIGSGRKGQSFLYWYDENIFQLPVSYYVPEKRWVNSPGYTPGFVSFNRNIPTGCFDCHSSYIKKTATKNIGNNMVDFFEKNQVIYGIDCERCHGPAAKHVDYHEANPLEKTARFITTISTLQRQQKLDMCAMCHSGARPTVKPSFTYKPGDKMDDYLVKDSAAIQPADIDVHGKQYQLLAASKCFLKSQVMTCSTCHNTHEQQRDNMALFSSKCVSCHQQVNHQPDTFKGIDQKMVTSNCISCHMPTKPSQLITMNSEEVTKPIPALVRTHFISIYPEETKKFLANNKK